MDSTVISDFLFEETSSLIDLKGVSVIFIYGIDLEYNYENASKWLHQQKNRALIFLEDDIHVFNKLSLTKNVSNLIYDPQVEAIFLSDEISNKTLFKRLSFTYIKETILICSSRSYSEERKENFDIIRQGLTYEFKIKSTLFNEYQRFGDVFYKNFYLNISLLPQSYIGTALFREFEGVPAIICGAGPSLDKNGEQLLKLQDKALIISGATALCALAKKGVVPHFGTAIDPYHSQYYRVCAVQDIQIPFFYRNRLCHEALKVLKGKRLYIPGTCGYTISEWFENELGIQSEVIEEGHSVVNFSLQIAQALGCNPIILMGVDCAYTGEKCYAEDSNACLDDNERTIDVKKGVKGTDIFGRPIMTEWKWIIEADWISEFAKNHQDCKIINATEGGLGFKNVPNCKLEEVADRWLRHSINQEEIIRAVNSCPSININQNQIRALASDLLGSLNRCVNLLNTLIDLCDKQICSCNFCHLSQKLLCDVEFEHEIAFKAILEDFSRVFYAMHQREEQENAKQNNEKEKVAFERLRYVFLKDAAESSCLQVRDVSST